MDFKAYRWRAHFEADTIHDLRPPEEIESWKKKCPIARLERRLLREGILDEKERETINAQVMADVEDRVKYAVESPSTPYDAEGLLKAAIRASVAKTGRLVVVDEACQTCGAAAEILSLVVEDDLTFSHLKSHPKRVCGLDVPFPFSPPMEQYAIPDKEKIVAAVRGVTGAMSTLGRGAVE